MIFLDVLEVDRSVEDVFFFVGGRNLGDCMRRNMAGRIITIRNYLDGFRWLKSHDVIT